MHWIGLFLSPFRRLPCRLFPCKVSPQICAPFASPPLCISPVDTVIPTRVRPHSVFFPFLPCCLPFPLFSCSQNGPHWACLCPCLCLACLRPCPCWACLWFCRPCRTIHTFGCFASILFSFDSLSPCDRKFHPITSFLTTFDLDCPSPTQASCFFVLIKRFRTISQISSILSCQKC